MLIVTYNLIFNISIFPNFNFFMISCFSLYYHFILFVLLFVMGKDIGRIYKHSQSQLLTLSLKTPVSSSSESQTNSAIKLTTTSVPPVTDKNQNNYFLYSQNTIHIDATITNNDNIYFCETERENYIIPTISTPNYNSQNIATTSSSILNLTYIKYYLRLVKNVCVL